MKTPTLSVWDTISTALNYYEEHLDGSCEEIIEIEAAIEDATAWLLSLEAAALSAAGGTGKGTR